jgi:hypothetical protein
MGNVDLHEEMLSTHNDSILGKGLREGIPKISDVFPPHPKLTPPPLPHPHQHPSKEKRMGETHM